MHTLPRYAKRPMELIHFVTVIIAGNGNEWKLLQCGFPYCMTHCSTTPDIKLKGPGNWILVTLHTNSPGSLREPRCVILLHYLYAVGIGAVLTRKFIIAVRLW